MTACCPHPQFLHFPTEDGDAECRAPGCACREPIRIPELPAWAVLHPWQDGRAAAYRPAMPEPAPARHVEGVSPSTVGVLLLVFMFTGFAIGSCSHQETHAMTSPVSTPWTLPPPASSPTTPGATP